MLNWSGFVALNYSVFIYFFYIFHTYSQAFLKRSTWSVNFLTAYSFADYRCYRYWKDTIMRSVTAWHNIQLGICCCLQEAAVCISATQSSRSRFQYHFVGCELWRKFVAPRAVHFFLVTFFIFTFYCFFLFFFTTKYTLQSSEQPTTSLIKRQYSRFDDVFNIDEESRACLKTI